MESKLIKVSILRTISGTEFIFIDDFKVKKDERMIKISHLIDADYEDIFDEEANLPLNKSEIIRIPVTSIDFISQVNVEESRIKIDEIF